MPSQRDANFFSNFTAAEKQELVRTMHERNFTSGATIYQPEEPSDTLYVVTAGEVVITSELDHKITAIGELAVGQFFGEGGLLRPGETHHSHARAAAEGTKLLLLPETPFLKIAEKSPAIAQKILLQIGATLASRVTEDTTRVAILSSISRIINEPNRLNNISGLAEEIVRITTTAIPSARAFLGVFARHDHGQLDILASRGLSAKHLPRSLPLDSDPYLTKLYQQDGEIRLTAERYAKADPVFYAKRNLLARAITIEANNVGVILLADKEEGDFTKENALLLEIIAGQISFALEEARLREEKKLREELNREYVGF